MPKPIIIPLTERQKKILIGLVLGDGNLEFNGFQGTRLQVKQCKRKKEYVWWLYEEFKNLCSVDSPRERQDNQEWYFGTRYLENLTKYYFLFYKKRKKRVPQEIKEILVDPLSVAVWFMDDGTLDFRRKNHYSYILHTEGFVKEEVKLLRDTLKENFGIQARIHKSSYRGSIRWKLYIGKEGRNIFYSLIHPYILSVFSYKLPPHKIS